MMRRKWKITHGVSNSSKLCSPCPLARTMVHVVSGEGRKKVKSDLNGAVIRVEMKTMSLTDFDFTIEY